MIIDVDGEIGIISGEFDAIIGYLNEEFLNTSGEAINNLSEAMIKAKDSFNEIVEEVKKHAEILKSGE